MEEMTLPEIGAPAGIDRDDETLTEMVEYALDVAESHLSDNREQADRMGMSPSGTVEDVLDNENIREVDVRARPFENPRITIWLSDCPTWANDAWRETGHPFGLNDYNGKVTATFDVRPF
jgi:hypothetical protein